MSELSTTIDECPVIEVAAGENVAVKKPQRTVWRESETKALLDIWPKYDEQLKKLSAKKPIFRLMADELKNDYGVVRDPEQVQKKMSKLRQEFAKYNQSLSGREDWAYYHEMEKLVKKETSPGDASATLEAAIEEAVGGTALQSITGDNKRIIPTLSVNCVNGSTVKKRKLLECQSKKPWKRRLIELSEAILKEQKQMADDIKELKKLYIDLINKLPSN